MSVRAFKMPLYKSLHRSVLDPVRKQLHPE